MKSINFGFACLCKSDVDFKGRVRWVRSIHCSQEVLLRALLPSSWCGESVYKSLSLADMGIGTICCYVVLWNLLDVSRVSVYFSSICVFYFSLGFLWCCFFVLKQKILYYVLVVASFFWFFFLINIVEVLIIVYFSPF